MNHHQTMSNEMGKPVESVENAEEQNVVTTSQKQRVQSQPQPQQQSQPQQQLQLTTFSTPSVRKEIITELRTIESLISLLNQNPGLVILKFGATWCKPCHEIKHIVDGFFAVSPQNVLCADLDVDINIMLYTYLKRRRMVNGIPVILMYKYGNKTVIPTDSVTGANVGDLDKFFRRCGMHLQSLTQAFARVAP